MAKLILLSQNGLGTGSVLINATEFRWEMDKDEYERGNDSKPQDLKVESMQEFMEEKTKKIYEEGEDHGNPLMLRSGASYGTHQEARLMIEDLQLD